MRTTMNTPASNETAVILGTLFNAYAPWYGRTPNPLEKIIPADNASDMEHDDGSHIELGLTIKRTYFAELAISGKWNFSGHEYSLSDRKWSFDWANRAGDKRTGYVIHFRTDNPDDSLLLHLFAAALIEDHQEYRASTMTDVHVAARILDGLRSTGCSIFTASTEQAGQVIDKLIPRSRNAGIELYSFISSLFGIHLLNNALMAHFPQSARTSVEANKTPLIATPLYLAVRDALAGDVMTKTYRTNGVQALACAALTAATGLRVSEVARLSRECLIPVPDHLDSGVLEYTSTKNQGSIVHTRHLPVPASTCRLIQHLQKEAAEMEAGNDLLFPARLRPGAADAAYTSWWKKNRQRISDALPDGCNTAEITARRPTFTEFRVYHMTELKHSHVPSRIISQMYGHMNAAMENYYVRGEDQPANDPLHVEEVARAVKNCTPLLGAKASVRIRQIREADIGSHAVPSVAQLAERLGSEFEIKRKNGGYCLVTSGRECAVDQSGTNEYDCAFGRCSNTIHFLFNLPENRAELKKLERCTDLNRRNGQTIAEWKTMQQIHRLITLVIRPELESLKHEISRVGQDEVLREYPQMKECITPKQIDAIEKEVTLWENRYQQMKTELRMQSGKTPNLSD